MKHFAIGAILPLLAASAVLPADLAKRQFGAATGEPQKALKVEEIKPQLRPDAKRIRITYGPYKLKAAGSKENLGSNRSMDPDGTSYRHLLGDDFPRNITAIDTFTFMADESGKKLGLESNIYDHHHVFFDNSQKPANFLACGDNLKPIQNMQSAIFMASATEDIQLRYTTNNGKFNAGYYIGPNDKLSVTTDMVNYNRVPKTVYTISEVEYVPGKIPGLHPANLQIVTMDMCNGGLSSASGIQVPEGKTKWQLTGSPMTVTKDGWFVNSKGHLHDGGVNIIMKINGKEACNSAASYGGPGHTTTSADGKTWNTLAEMTYCPETIPLKKGDKITFEANYDLDKHPSRQHAHSDGMAEQMALWIPMFAAQES